MNRYLIQYQRVSSSKQLQGTGLAQQTLSNEHISELCTKHELSPYPELFVDSGVSGFSINASERPSFSKLLELLESGSVHPDSIVVLWNIDRLSREDPHTALTTLMRITAHCRLYISSENRIFAKGDPNLAGELMFIIVGLVRAHEESLTKSKRTIGAALHKISQHNNGERGKTNKPLSIPVGKLPFWYFKSKGEIHQDKRLIELVRAIAHLLTTGVSVYKIHQWLNRYHAAPRSYKNNEWRISTIRNLHKDRSLLGEFTLNIKGTSYELNDYLEPILSEEEFYSLALKRNHTPKENRVTGYTSAFTGIGLATCVHCGCAVIGSQHHNQGMQIRCTGRLQNKCQGVSMMDKHVEQAINSLPSFWFHLPKAQAKDTNPIRFKLKELQTKLEKISADYLELPVRATLEVMASLEQQIDSLKLELKEDEQTELLNQLEQHADLNGGQIQVSEFPYSGYKVPVLPTDRNQLRELYSSVFNRILFCRIEKGVVLVSVFTKSKLVMHFLMKRGKVIKQGQLTDSLVNENELIDREKLLYVIGSNAFKKWRNES